MDFVPCEGDVDVWRRPHEKEDGAKYYEYIFANEIRTLKGELVKSLGECLIANYLFEQGVEYEYERADHLAQEIHGQRANGRRRAKRPERPWRVLRSWHDDQPGKTGGCGKTAVRATGRRAH